MVIDNAPAKEYVAANPGLKVLETSYAEEDYAIGMAKGSFSGRCRQRRSGRAEG